MSHYSDQDKTQGLAIWTVADYLALIWKHRAQGPYLPACLSGIDYVPYENVLPNASRFDAEYVALPEGRPVTLTGELRKEAMTWGLSPRWADKRDFVCAIQGKLKDFFAIQARRTRLLQALEEICRRLHKPDNHKTIEAFRVQNSKEIDANTNDILKGVFRYVLGNPFLPQASLRSSRGASFEPKLGSRAATSQPARQSRTPKRSLWGLLPPLLIALGGAL